MLSDVCRYLNNWFDAERIFGTFVISGGNVTGMEDKLQTGQYFRIVDSVFNDGVYKYPAMLKDETFDGAVWLMKVPPEVVEISDEIDAWMAQYGAADSEAMSPYASESFGGYSYTKASGENGVGSAWEGVAGFKSRLEGWRRPRCRY